MNFMKFTIQYYYPYIYSLITVGIKEIEIYQITLHLITECSTTFNKYDTECNVYEVLNNLVL